MAKDRSIDRHKNRTHESEAARAAAMVARHADVTVDFENALKNVDWERRERCAASLNEFARTYCVGEGGFLEVAPPPSMVGILDEMQTAIGDSSTPYHIRIARGHGKTSYMKCAAAWALSFGLRRYIVSVSSDARKASAIISDIIAFMTSAPTWCEDFPEISVPLKRLGGAYQRAKSQTCKGENTNIRLSASEIKLPTVKNEEGELYPAAGAILSAVGLTGNARGLVRGSLRPDLVLLDDLQNDTMAKSEERVAETAQLIKKSFMGLAGHRRKIAAIMTSTPIEPDDLSETFAADKAWKTTTYKMVKSWPKCFRRKDGGVDLWQEYADLYQSELVAGRKPHIKANRFYMDNRAEMDDEAEVLNPDNFDEKTEKSGIQHAMNILFRDGMNAFLSEYQMEPPRHSFAFEITPTMILSRIRRGVMPNTIPNGTVLTAAATDINPSYGLTTTIVTFDINLTAFVTAYHVTPIKIPQKLNDVEYARQIHDALSKHGREIAALGIKIDRWGVDCGGRQFNAVTHFAPASESVCGLSAMPMLGRAGLNWNPNVRSRIRSARNATVLCRDQQRRKWLAWNADEHKERMQRAWGSEVGAPGGLSLFDGNTNHTKFAIQVSNERLQDKKKAKAFTGEDRWAYTWKTREPHDYGDCLAMCFALASAEGLTGAGTEGEEMTAPRRSRLAIGGRIVGDVPTAPEPSESLDSAESAPIRAPVMQPPRRRIAIGGRII